LLFYDGSALWMCAKRLDKGRFCWPESEGASTKVVLMAEAEQIRQLQQQLQWAELKIRSVEGR